MSFHETSHMPIGECISKEALWNIQRYDRIKNTNLMIRVAKADDHFYVSTVEPREYLDDTVVYLDPIRAILGWQKFVHNHKNWRSQ